MKISCQTCQAKYTIADEKVAGKTVKIKCKKCGDNIVVSGGIETATSPTSAAGMAPAGGFSAGGMGFDEEDESTQIFAGDPREALAAAAAEAAGGVEWTVNISDTDQRTMTPDQISAELRSGALAADTYVWRDGMGDWLPISQVPELAALVPAAPAAPAPAEDLDSTVMRPSGAGFSPFSPPAAAAARRSASRPSVDPFDAPAAAGLAPAASAGLAAAPEGADRHIGERNENSVLFSLSALTAAESAAKAPKAPTPPPARGGRAPTMNRAGLDDLMNLGSGGMGMGGPILAPPPLTAPVVEAPPPPAPMPMQTPMQMAPQMAPPASAYNPAMQAPPGYGADEFAPKKSKAGLFVGLGLAAVVLIGGTVFALSGGASGEATTAASAAATSEPAATAAPEAAPTTTATAEPAASAAPSAEPSAAPSAEASAEPAADDEPSAAKVASATTKTSGATSGSTTKKPTDTKAADTKAADTKKPADTKAAPEPAPAAGASDAPFNRGAASAALSSAANNAQGCKKPDGPTGSGRVSVTFAASGRVTSATVQGAPFAGTSVGGCIAGVFRGASVPPFKGSSVTASKSFSIR